MAIDSYEWVIKRKISRECPLVIERRIPVNPREGTSQARLGSSR